MSYEFDIAWDFDFNQMIFYINIFNLNIEKYTKIGPGGGNQNFTVSGNPDNVNQFIKYIQSI